VIATLRDFFHMGSVECVTYHVPSTHGIGGAVKLFVVVEGVMLVLGARREILDILRTIEEARGRSCRGGKKSRSCICPLAVKYLGLDLMKYEYRAQAFRAVLSCKFTQEKSFIHIVISAEHKLSEACLPELQIFQMCLKMLQETVEYAL
jgi:hypothetical protein